MHIDTWSHWIFLTFVLYYKGLFFFIIILISLKVAFIQAFLTSAGNMVASEKFLGYGIKWDTSDPASPKVGTELFNSFKTYLKTLLKPLTIFFAYSYDIFH